MAYDSNDTDKSSIYDTSYIHRKMDEFVCSRQFIRKKLKKGKLFCDLCKIPFPVNLPSFIKVDDDKEEICCVACYNKKHGINPEEIYKAERAKVGIMPIVKREYKKKEQKEKKSKKNKNQASLF